MFSPSRLKTLHPLQVFSVKSSPSSSALSSMKLKSLIHTLILSHMCRIIRALSKLKTLIIGILKDNHSNIHFPYLSQKKHCRKSKKIIMGSFRLHYNWCSSKSSHVLPVAERVYQGLPADSATHLCYDSNWNTTVIPAEQQAAGDIDDCLDSQLAGYLQWLEENVHDDGKDIISSTTNEKDNINKIDMLAEMFIANCHEKFKLEKQESDRRFQEMLARSL